MIEDDIIFLIEEEETPIIATAIHDGHEVRPRLLPYFELDEAGRLREEDPYTATFTEVARAKIIGLRSRFEVDLNRPPERNVYRKPEDAWGLHVWKEDLPEVMVDHAKAAYDFFYQSVGDFLDPLVEEFGSIVVLDIHSYNHRRQGPDAAPDSPQDNPEVNIGTGNMNRTLWAPLVEGFISDMRSYDYDGRALDVRENIKFTGGYFSRWLYERYGDRVCPIAVEFKKIFMDEWTGEPFADEINKLEDALRSTIDGIVAQRSRITQQHLTV